MPAAGDVFWSGCRVDLTRRALDSSETRQTPRDPLTFGEDRALWQLALATCIEHDRVPGESNLPGNNGHKSDCFKTTIL